MKILLLGFGLSNKAVYKYFKDDDIEIICQDEIAKIKQFKTKLDTYDYCFRSPGISYDNSLYLLGNALSKVTTNEISYALNQCKDKKIIGITGSDGKTSLVKLIEHTLSHFKTVKSVGNIGNTLLDKLDEYQNKEYIVVELSSFQLENFTSYLDLGIIKNLHPNHLDVYKNKELYFANKIRIIPYSNKLIFGESLKIKNNKELNYNFYRKGNYIYEEQVELLDLKKLKHKDKSFIENIIITLKVLKYYGIKYFHLEEIFNTFQGVKYRLENLGTYKNTTFINDGKSSTSASSKYAYTNYKGKKILILGGIHKSSPFNFKINKEDQVYIYGKDRLKIRRELNQGKTFLKLYNILKLIKFDKKQTIIFSPGCSSFDQYDNYIKRSEEFEKWVKTWIK